MSDIPESELLDVLADKGWGSYERFQAYFQRAPYGIIVTDNQSNVVEANQAVAETLGYPLEQLQNMAVPDLAFPEHVDLSKVVYGQLLSSGKMDRVVRMRKPDGTLIWIHLKGGRIGPNRLVASLRDVSAEVRAEQKLLEKEATLNRLSETMRDFVAEIDLDGRYTYVSPSYTAYLNLQPEQLLGRWIMERVHPEDHQKILDKLKIAASGVVAVDALFRYMDGYGGWRWMESRGGLVYDDSGAPVRFAVSSRDVTDRQSALQARVNTEGALRAFLDSIPDLAFIKDENLNNIYLNAAYLRFLGKTLEEVVGLPDSQLIAAPWAHKCRQSDLRSIQMRTTVVEEEDGGDRVYETTKFPVLLGSGATGLGGIIRDITERRRAREQLEHRLLTLTDPISEIHELQFSDVFDLKTAQTLIDGVYRAMGVTSQIVDQSGRPLSETPANPAICGIVRRSGIVCGEVCRVHPGSPQHQSELSCVRTCHQCGLMFGSIPIRIEEQVVGYWNVGWVSNAGVSRTEMMRLALDLGLDERAYVEAVAQAPALTQEEFAAAMEFVSVLAHQLAQLALRNLQQARFIQQQRVAQEERRLLEEQLQHAQKMEAIGRLAGSIAHDFGNLLTTVVGNLSLAKMELPDLHPAHEYLAEIETAAQRAENLTRQVLAFSRKQVIDFRVLDPRKVIGNMARLLGRLLGEDIALRVEMEEAGAILADAGQLEQIVANLMVNARDAMPAGGELLLRLATVDLEEDLQVETGSVPPGAFVMLEVRDSGTGMTEEVKKHLFEPFFTTKGKEKGTGLGLAIVYGAVVQHRAYVLVDSKLGHGTSIRIYFPRVGEAPNEAEPTPDLKSAHGRESILVVEDDLSLNLAVTRGLQRLGYTVFSETHPAKALEFVRRYEGVLHAVVSDVVMPEMSGDELCRQISELRPGVALVLTSGYTDNRMAEDLVLGGQVQFLRKPYSLPALTSTLRQMLGPLPESR